MADDLDDVLFRIQIACTTVTVDRIMPVSINGEPAPGVPYWQRGTSSPEDPMEWFRANEQPIREAMSLYRLHGPERAAKLLTS